MRPSEYKRADRLGPNVLAPCGVYLDDIDAGAHAVEDVAAHITALVLFDHDPVGVVSVIQGNRPPRPLLRRTPRRSIFQNIAMPGLAGRHHHDAVARRNARGWTPPGQRLQDARQIVRQLTPPPLVDIAHCPDSADRLRLIVA
jgi:hypothetical protein